MKKSVVFLVLMAVLALVPGSAMAQDPCTLVDFEGGLDNLPPGVSFTDWVAIVFNEALSGTMVLRPSDQQVMASVDFTEAVNCVSFHYRSDVPVAVTAFNAAGEVVDTASGPATGDAPTFGEWEQLFLKSDECEITMLVFSNGIDKLDDLEFCRECNGGGAGTGTPGYWKTHPEAWPVDEITVGGVTYTIDEAIDGMNGRNRDRTVTMFNHLVAAMLNVLNGTAVSCIGDTIDAANDWMVTYPLGSDVRGGSDAWEVGEPLKNTLDAYNNGLLCAPPRD